MPIWEQNWGYKLDISSDEDSLKFLKSPRTIRIGELKADEGAVYMKLLSLIFLLWNLLVACPHSPDKVVKVKELVGTKGSGLYWELYKFILC